MGLRGKHTKIWVGGYVLTTKTKDIAASIAADELEESGYSQDHSTLKGQFTSDITLDGYFSPTTGETHTALNSLSDTNKVVSTALGENAAPAQGDITISLDAEQMNYEVVPNLTDVIGAMANFKQTGNPAEFGILLADETAVSSNSNTSSVDQSAQSSNGAAAALHITGVSASDTITVKVQDSANDSDWADLITFTLDGSAVGAERATVSGTVDRYVRVLWTVTGSGIDFDFAVMFIRK